MKTINKHNYEAYAIDYMSGELTPDIEQAFIEFLGDNPEIADDFLLFETSPLKEENSHKDFSSLRKDLNGIKINANNIEEFCIASAEGDLDASKQKEFRIYIKNNKLQHLASSYSQLKLKADNYTYPHKESLKQSVHKPLFSKRWFAIISSSAAIIALAISLWTPNNTIEPVSELAMTSSFKNFEIVPQKPKLKTTISDEVFETPQNEKHQAPQTLLAHEQAKRKDIPTVKQNKQETLQRLASKKSTIKSLATNPIQQIALTATQLDQKNTTNNNSSNNFKQLASNYIYTKVLTKGVENINRIAETSLDYQVIENKNGEPVKVTFSTRFGKINHTLAQK